MQNNVQGHGWLLASVRAVRRRVAAVLPRPAFRGHGPRWWPRSFARPACGQSRASRSRAVAGATLLLVPWLCCRCWRPRRCWSAQAATCGRWVTASTWRSLTQALHERPTVCGHRAAHAGIDLVKDQRARLAQLAGGHGNGQRDARQLAARGDLATGRGVAPGWPATRNCTLIQPVGPGSARGSMHVKAAALSCPDPAWPA